MDDVYRLSLIHIFPMLLWSWTFISILSIAWNSSIGGACALATLPMILWECFHEKGWKIFFRLNEKEVRRKILPWYIPVSYTHLEDQKWTVFRYVGGLWELAMMTLAHLFTVFPELAKSRRVWKEQAGAGEKKPVSYTHLRLCTELR